MVFCSHMEPGGLVVVVVVVDFASGFMDKPTPYFPIKAPFTISTQTPNLHGWWNPREGERHLSGFASDWGWAELFPSIFADEADQQMLFGTKAKALSRSESLHSSPFNGLELEWISNLKA